MNYAFTAFSKKYRILAAIALLVIVSGCGAQGTIDSSTPGFFNHYVVFPFSYLIQHIASFFGDNYGIAIIVMTLLVRIVLLPLMLRQYKSQQTMRQKMSVLKPELDKLKEKHKGKDTQAQLQKETMELYSKHQVNPMAVGCLPMLIQLPVLTGLYYAIKMTPELAQHSFLWFQLGSADHILPFLAAAIYYVQFKVPQMNADPAQQKQMAMVGLISPVMMGLFSFSAPAAVPLYWVVGGIFMIGQSYVSKKLYPSMPTTVTDTAKAVPAK